MNRYVVLYLATLFVLLPLDFLFLGMIAKGFFTSEVGDMLGEIRLAPAILFYLLYAVGILVFVSGSAAADWQSTLLYGALFGFFVTRPSNSPRGRCSSTGPGRWSRSMSPGALLSRRCRRSPAY